MTATFSHGLSGRNRETGRHCQAAQPKGRVYYRVARHRSSMVRLLPSRISTSAQAPSVASRTKAKSNGGTITEICPHRFSCRFDIPLDASATPR
jgi:hypothetical protein